MSDLSDRLIPYKTRAQRHKKNAVAARKANDLDLAKAEFEEAHFDVSDALDEIGPLAGSTSGAIDQATKEQAFALADWYGIRGGILREEGKIEESIRSYDDGYELEADPQYEINSTYNTVNRLVLRLLNNEKLLQPDAPRIKSKTGDKTARQLLEEAAAAIELKWKLMTDPVWALADAVLIKTLLQSPDVEEWENRLKEKARDRFPFDSLAAVVKALAAANIPAAGALNQLGARLAQHVAEKWPADHTPSPTG